MPFAFSAVYASDAPQTLPFHELLVGLLVRAAQGLRMALRVALVLCVWLVAIPVCTCWMWRLAFSRSLFLHSSEYDGVFRLQPAHFVADCIYGALISAGIVLSFLAVTSLRDYIRQARIPPAAHAWALRSAWR